MTTRGLIATFARLDGTLWADAPVLVRLLERHAVSDGQVLPGSTWTENSDGGGFVRFDLPVPPTGAWRYQITDPAGVPFTFAHGSGVGDVSLDVLKASMNVGSSAAADPLVDLLTTSLSAYLPRITGLVEYIEAPTGAANDATDGIAAALSRRGSAEKHKQFVLSDGQHYVQPGALVLAGGNANSFVFEGVGAGRNAATLAPLDATDAPLLQIGDGGPGSNAFNWALRHLDLDGKGQTRSTGLLRVLGAFFFTLGPHLTVRDFGDGVGVKVAPGAEGILNNCDLFGYAIGSGEGQGTAFDLELTRIATLRGNAEHCHTGYHLRGRGLCLVQSMSATVERVTYAIIAEDIQLVGALSDHSGQLFLGEGCVGGDLRMSPVSPTQFTFAVVDNGFGNRLTRPSGQAVTVAGAPGFNTVQRVGYHSDGLEWHRVPSPVDGARPDTADWAAQDATLRRLPATLPGLEAHGGYALQIDPTLDGGHAWRDFPAEPETDALLHLWFVANEHTAANVRVRVEEEGGTLVLDTGPRGWKTPHQNRHLFRSVRKRLRSGPGNTRFRVFIEGLAAGVPVQLMYAALHPSQLDMTADVAGADSQADDATYALADRSAYQVFTKSVNPGTLSFAQAGVGFDGACLVRFRADVTSGEVRVGIGGTASDREALTMCILRPGAHEYCLYLPHGFPEDGQIVFFNGGRVGTVAVSELTIHEVYRHRVRRTETTRSGPIGSNGSRHLFIAGGHALAKRFTFALTTDAAGTATDHWTLELRLLRAGVTIALGTLTNDGVTWAKNTPVALPLDPVADRLLVPGDILSVEAIQTGDPGPLNHPVFQCALDALSL